MFISLHKNFIPSKCVKFFSNNFKFIVQKYDVNKRISIYVSQGHLKYLLDGTEKNGHLLYNTVKDLKTSQKKKYHMKSVSIKQHSLPNERHRFFLFQLITQQKKRRIFWENFALLFSLIALPLDSGFLYHLFHFYFIFFYLSLC